MDKDDLVKKVKFFTQSYREAKESGTVDELEALGIVEGSLRATFPASVIGIGSFSALPGEPFGSRTLGSIKFYMAEAAHKLAPNENQYYIFGIDYKFENLGEQFITLGTGDAYRDKS